MVKLPEHVLMQQRNVKDTLAKQLSNDTIILEKVDYSDPDENNKRTITIEFIEVDEIEVISQEEFDEYKKQEADLGNV